MTDGGQPIANDDQNEPPWKTLGPSDIPERKGYPVPKSMSHKEIIEVIEAFKNAAKRALIAGFDTIEIHGAHGYLIHSFFHQYQIIGRINWRQSKTQNDTAYGH